MYRDRFGVELICRTLGSTPGGFITSRGYRATKTRPKSDRAVRDGILIAEIQRLHAENYGVYGIRKMWSLLKRHGRMIGRDQTARLMRLAGVRGATRARRVFTTRADPRMPQPEDLVQRRFTAPAPRQLWVADIERHEAFLNPAVVKGHRLPCVAARG